ncbi:hypothetical protein BGZ59_000807 [Podila verticillata]|nr:hypothetical protein BGZ59_000807 [Podila verticillata]KFH67591.1 hypothetical protein MVEG_06323 [Podila verticillata NRRL 6337]
MKAAAFIVLGAALQLLASSTVQGLPFDSQAATFADWRATIDHARNQTGVPGMSVAVLHQGKVIFAEGFGTRNKERDPVTADTLMPIGSMTKAMTAAMIGELVAEGKLDWDKTPVVEYVPEAKFDPIVSAELTLSDYLSHRTGLPHDDEPWTNTTETRAHVYRRLKHLHIPTKLSSDLQYSNIGYSIAGEAAANVAGIPYERLVRNKIFRPLGLTHTGFSPIDMGKRPNHAMPFYADSLEDAQAGKFHEGYLDNLIELNAAAGDIYSNVYDLLRWGNTIMKFGELDGKQVLNKEAIEEQLKAHTIYRSVKTLPELAPAANYGFGWFMDSYKGQTVYYHGGNTLGFSSMIAFFPDSDLVITTLSNVYIAALPMFLHYYLADEILNLPRTRDWTGAVALDQAIRFFNFTAKEALGNFPPRQKNSPASHPLVQYEGTYTHPLFAGDVIISSEGDGNKKNLHFKYATFESKMEHYHFETFSYIFDSWSNKEARLMTFATGQDGEVSGMQIEYLHKKWNFEKKTKDASWTKVDDIQKEEEEGVDIGLDDEELDIFGQEQGSLQFQMLKTY